MFGYIAPLKSELKIREFEVYNAYYCAICHAVKRRYGELPRLMLSYDAVFIALMAEGLIGVPETLQFTTFRCLNNPFKKRNEASESIAIDYAANVMVLLGWLSLKDRKEDGDERNPAKALATIAGESILRSAGFKATEKLGEKARIILGLYGEQTELESVNSDSIDLAADPTGHMMEELMDFSELPGMPGSMLPIPALRELGYHLGRYIYIIDAIDDFEKDSKTGAYNPLLIRHESPEALELAVSMDLAKVCELLQTMGLGNHKDIIENIVYLGLRAKLDEVMGRFRLAGVNAAIAEEKEL